MAPEQRLLWRVRMEAGRIGDRGRRSQPAAARNRITPFPFPLRGKPGREGSPHAAKSAAPPTRGLRPLVNPPRFSTGWLTGAGLLMEAATARERFFGYIITFACQSRCWLQKSFEPRSE